MNEYLFYTLEGYTNPPREDKEVDNCQILGFAWGNDEYEARKALLEENPWIEEVGFNPRKVIARQMIADSPRLFFESFPT